MKIGRKTDPALGRVLYRLDPGEYDGLPPVRDIWIDGRVQGASPDRLCIAEALLAYNYLGGPVTFSTACSPRIATGLTRFLAPRNIFVTSVSLQNRANPVGGRLASLMVEGAMPRGQAEFTICLAPDARFRTIFDTDSAVFASNVRTLTRLGEGDGLVMLALTILFAQDLSIRGLVMHRRALQKLSDDSVDALRNVLTGTDLTLDIVGSLADRQNEAA